MKKQLNNELAKALDCLASMWNQYCPKPWTHMCMGAGENTEEMLEEYDLMRHDESAINTEDEDYPYIVPLPFSESETRIKQ